EEPGQSEDPRNRGGAAPAGRERDRRPANEEGLTFVQSITVSCGSSPEFSTRSVVTVTVKWASSFQSLPIGATNKEIHHEDRRNRRQRAHWQETDPLAARAGPRGRVGLPLVGRQHHHR